MLCKTLAHKRLEYNLYFERSREENLTKLVCFRKQDGLESLGGELYEPCSALRVRYNIIRFQLFMMRSEFTF